MIMIDNEGNEVLLDSEVIRDVNRRAKKLHAGLVAIRESLQTNTLMSRDEEDYFTEFARRNSTKPFRVAASMMEHLLKIGYADNTHTKYQYYKRLWIQHFHRNKNDIEKIKSAAPNWDDLESGMRSDFQRIYRDGVKLYKVQAKIYSTVPNDLLSIGLTRLPSTSPWTIDELMQNDVNTLLQKTHNG